MPLMFSLLIVTGFFQSVFWTATNAFTFADIDDKDAGQVLCHDPACESDKDVFKRYPLQDFLRAWETSHRLAYVAEYNV